jgi:hypothetical protein
MEFMSIENLYIAFILSVLAAEMNAGGRRFLPVSTAVRA